MQHIAALTREKSYLQYMGSLTISNKVLDKYFAFLSRFDTQTKKKLIIKLTDSIETSPTPQVDLRALFGAWEDHRSSEEIIDEIRQSRVENRNLESF
jgi:hypothetical protein